MHCLNCIRCMQNSTFETGLGSIPYLHTHVHSRKILGFGTFAAGNLKFLDGKVSVCYGCMLGRPRDARYQLF